VKELGISMKGVEHLSKMKNLRNMAVHTDYSYDDDNNSIWAHAAGRIPNLKHFTYNVELSSDFFNQYTKLYPGKKLVLRQLWYYLYLHLFY